MPLPRKPGSQVAPGQKPFHSSAPTTIGHSKVPIEQATAGKRYRVRDRHDGDAPGAVWGEDLSWPEALKLKDQVVAARKSRTARVEDMDVPMPGVAADEVSDFDSLMVVANEMKATHNPNPLGGIVRSDGSILVPIPAMGVAFEIGDADPHEIPSRGVVFTIPAGHELVVNGTAQDLPAVVEAGDIAQARPLDQALAVARAAALAAARPLAAHANARRAYRDKTVVAPQPRVVPPPRDKTVSKAPPLVRLGAPPTAPPKPLESPLKVATRPDGDAIPDDSLGDEDLHDLDVGGGASEADVEHASRLRDQAGR